MMIVSGRRRAARSSHIPTVLPGSYREEKSQERLEIALRRQRNGRQVFARRRARAKSVVRFGLHEEALCVRNVTASPGCLVTRAFLFSVVARVEFQAECLSNVGGGGPFERSLRLPELTGSGLQRLIERAASARSFADSNAFSGPDSKNIEQRKVTVTPTAQLEAVRPKPLVPPRSCPR